jgi:hypothetical protein
MLSLFSRNWTKTMLAVASMTSSLSLADVSPADTKEIIDILLEVAEKSDHAIDVNLTALPADIEFPVSLPVKESAQPEVTSSKDYRLSELGSTVSKAFNSAGKYLEEFKREVSSPDVLLGAVVLGAGYKIYQQNRVISAFDKKFTSLDLCHSNLLDAHRQAIVTNSQLIEHFGQTLDANVDLLGARDDEFRKSINGLNEKAAVLNEVLLAMAGQLDSKFDGLIAEQSKVLTEFANQANETVESFEQAVARVDERTAYVTSLSADGLKKLGILPALAAGQKIAPRKQLTAAVTKLTDLVIGLSGELANLQTSNIGYRKTIDFLKTQYIGMLEAHHKTTQPVQATEQVKTTNANESEPSEAEIQQFKADCQRAVCDAVAIRAAVGI